MICDRDLATSDPVVALYAAMVKLAIRDLSDRRYREDAKRFLSEPQNQRIAELLKEGDSEVRSV